MVDTVNPPLPNIRGDAPTRPIVENGLYVININRKDIKKANERYNNPGAMYPGSVAKKYGSLSFGYLISSNGKHKIAFFPTPEAGAAANIQLLKDGYSELNVGQAIKKWRGTDSEGNPNPGSDFVPEGFKATDSIDEIIYDQDRLTDFMKKMAKHEGSNYLSDSQWTKAYEYFSAGGYTPTMEQKKEQILYALEYATTKSDKASDGSRLVQYRDNKGADDLDSIDPSSESFSNRGTSTNTKGRNPASTNVDRSGLVNRGERSNLSVLDTIKSFGTRQLIQRAPDAVLSEIEGALGSGLSELAPSIMSSLQTGSGISLIQQSTARLAGKDFESRIEELRQIALENPTLAQGVFEASGVELPLGLSFDQFVAELPSVSEIMKVQDPKERLLLLYNKARELDPESIPSVYEMLSDVDGVDVSQEYQKALSGTLKVEELSLEQLLNRESYVPFSIGKIEKQNEALADAIREGDLESLSKLLADALPGIGDRYDPVIKPGEDRRGLYNPELDVISESGNLGIFGTREYEDVEYYSPDVAAAMELLSGDMKSLFESPLAKSYLGEDYGTAETILTGSERSIQNEISKIISEKSGLSKTSAYTLAYGGTKEAAKKLQSESADIAFEGLVESFPILGQIIDFFSNNQGILTLLGTLGGTMGLSALAGGGLTGGLLGGAGAMLGARAVLGKEGYEKFQSTLGEGAEVAVGIFRDLFQKSGLAENEMIAPVMESIFGFAEANPVATALGATGNLGAAVGSMLGAAGVDFVDNPQALDRLLGRFEKVSFEPSSSESAVAQVVSNSNGGERNRQGTISDQSSPQLDSGPAAKEIARVTGDMYQSRAWAHVDTDSGYGWPHSTVNS